MIFKKNRSDETPSSCSRDDSNHTSAKSREWEVMVIACPNESGSCAKKSSPKCSGTVASLWYGKSGSKKCKACYLEDKKDNAVCTPGSKRQMQEVLEMDMTDLDMMGADCRISELHAILDQRRFSEAKLLRWERRNADYKRVKAFEYKVHVTVHENEDDIEGEKTIIWAAVEVLMGIVGLDYPELKEMIDEFETEIEAERDEALAGFEPTGTA